MKKEEFYNKLAKIPKAELHVHAEGMISRKSVLTLFQRAYPEKNYTASEIDELFCFDDLSSFISVFIAVQKLFTINDFDLLVNDIKEYFQENGVVYAEVFLAPTSFIRNGMNFFDVMERVVHQTRIIQKENNITTRYLIDVSRGFGIENAMHNLDITVELRKKYPEIIGIGLGGDEGKGPAKEFAPVFEKAEQKGLKLVAHAGESVGPESVWDSINYLKVKRIGHGISCIFDETLMQCLREKQISLEICPTSNVFTKKYVSVIEKHPIQFLYKEGVPLTLNSDDPAFFGVGLLDEYYNLYDKLGFSLDDVKRLILNSFQFSFLPEELKAEKKKLVETLWNKQFSPES